MFRPTSITIILMGVLFATPISAQYQGAKNAIGMRLLNVDPVEEYSDKVNQSFVNGLEIEYSRHLANFLNLAVPVKAGVFQTDNQSSRNGFFGADALLQLKYFKEPVFLYPYLLAGVGAHMGDGGEFEGYAPLGAGLNFRLGKHIYLSTKGEYRLGLSDAAKDHYQVGLGLLAILGPVSGKEMAAPADRDGDGIADALDLCPDVAGKKELNGCPDSDGDGIADGSDKCPNQAGIAALKGCPDSDGDGVADSDDKCPNQKGLAALAGCPDTDGDGIADADDKCPTVKGLPALGGCPQTDSDGDGIADADDKCPTLKGLKALAGCPDSDGDGIADPADKCPNTAGPASNNGCPEIKKEDKEVLTLAMKAVQFETGSAKLLASSNTILNQIVEILAKYPDYKIRISGHTDSIGEAQPNLVLSEKRAKACYDYLIAKGIAAGRMSFAGFGETRPIADNINKAGRDQNRRVEFDLYVD